MNRQSQEGHSRACLARASSGRSAIVGDGRTPSNFPQQGGPAASHLSIHPGPPDPLLYDVRNIFDAMVVVGSVVLVIFVAILAACLGD